MRIPARFAPLLFGALLSAIMVSLVSAFVLLVNQGLHAGFLVRNLELDLGGDTAALRGSAPGSRPSRQR